MAVTYNESNSFTAVRGPRKYFPISEQCKGLIKDSLEVIKKQGKTSKLEPLKTWFRQVLTDSALSNEKREAKVRFGLSKIAVYLHRIGAKAEADSILSKLTVVDSKFNTKSFPRFDLERRIDAFLTEFAEQNRVWANATDFQRTNTDAGRHALTTSFANHRAGHQLQVQPSTFSQVVMDKPAVTDGEEGSSLTAIQPLVKRLFCV